MSVEKVLCLSVVMALVFSMITLPLTSAQSNDYYYPIDGWKISSPEEYGMNATRLDDMVAYIEDTPVSVNSIAIIKNGTLIFERYFSFFDENTTTNIFSCTKSFTSTCVGIAIDQGYIENTSVKVLDYFRDRTLQNPDSRKEAITIEDLLTMRAGFVWDDNSASGSSNYNQMIQTDDWVQYFLDQPMALDPGIEWNYNSGASLLLSAIVQNATGMTAEDYALEHLFEPLGITDITWRESPNGITIGGNTITLRARDMARFGYLFLRNGSWAGTQIISSDWVQNVAYPHTEIGIGQSYSYQWWIRHDVNSFYAVGYAGQYIFVLPDYDAVVVFQATTGSQIDPITRWIVPAFTEEPGYITVQETSNPTPETSPDDSLNLYEFVIPLSSGVGVSLVIIFYALQRRKI